MKKKWFQISLDQLKDLIRKNSHYTIPIDAKIVVFGIDELTNNKDIVMQIEVYEEVDY